MHQFPPEALCLLHFNPEYGPIPSYAKFAARWLRQVARGLEEGEEFTQVCILERPKPTSAGRAGRDLYRP